MLVLFVNVLLGSLYTVLVNVGGLGSAYVFLGAACVVGGSAYLLVHEGRVRGAWLGAATGTLTTMAFLYGRYHQLAAMDAPFHPLRLWEAVKAATNPGVVLYAVWSIEAMLAFCLGIFVAATKSIEPFCSVCNKWTKEIKRSYGPFREQDLAVREILLGRFTRFFALSTTAPDKTRSTLARIESCECLGTALLTLSSRNADRSPRGELVKAKETKLVERLYLAEHIARPVREWIASTASIRVNLVEADEPVLRTVVGALLTATSQKENGIFVYGDIPKDKAEKARKKARIPADKMLAGLAEFFQLPRFHR